MKNKLFLLLLLPAIAFLLFISLRISNLNGIPVFVDEAIYIRWSQVMRTEPTLRFLPLSDGKQPLFMWATIPFLKVFSDPLIAGRAVSIASGLGTLIGMGVLTFVLTSNSLLAIFSTLIYAVLPFSVFFDRLALADSLLAMFGIWSLTFSILFARSRRLDHAMILGFIVGGGLLTKSPATIFYAWILIAMIFFYRKEKNKALNIGNLLICLFAILAISQGMYSILRLGPGFGMMASRNQDYIFSWMEVLRHPLNPFLGNIKTTFSWIWYLFTPALLIPLVLGALQPKNRRIYLFLLLVCVIPLVGQASIAKVYTSRYILYAILPLVPLVSTGMYWLATRKGLLIKSSALVLFIVPLLISGYTVLEPTKMPMPYDMHSGYLEEWTAGWGQKDIAQYLIQRNKEGNKIVVFTEGYFGTLPDGLQIYTEGIKDITIVGSPPGVYSIPEGLVNTDPKNLRFLVVNKSRNHLSAADISKLSLIKEYPKTPRSDGTTEALQFFELKK